MWKTPKPLEVAALPTIGAAAPSSARLVLPNPNGKPSIITFLRHCGCPFAEKTFQQLRKCAGEHPEVNFVAVSHSDEDATEKWVIAVGGEWEVTVVVDPEREIYAHFGLGVSSTWHVLNPWSLYSAYKLGKQERIWNRPTESGSRWQMAGSFAVDSKGIIRWERIASAADDNPAFQDALEALGVEA